MSAAYENHAPLMECGHTAQGRNADGWCCVICVMIHPGARTPMKEPPSLSERKAECGYCKHTVASKYDLAFFESRPLLPTDGFYCGCRGWS